MNYIALIIGKIIAFIGKLLHRGSSLPGKIALKLAPNLLKKFHLPERVIFVTGTNGKTTVTHYLAEIFSTAGYTTVTNAEGANMIQGIATQLIRKAHWNFNVPQEALILEVDEGTLPRLMAQITPTLLVMNNLFPDQEDRFGSADELMEYLNQMIPQLEKPRLLLNANDPRLVKIGVDHEKNQPVYYGIEADTLNQPAHAMNCPICGLPLNYAAHYYEHIGDFSCENGHFATPTADYLAQQVNLTERTFVLNEHLYTFPQDNIYTAYNALAAASAALFFQVPPEKINTALQKDFSIKGRMDQVTVNGQTLAANLAKNPAGFNQSLVAVKKQVHGPFDLTLIVNTREADGTQPDWLYHCELETLNLPELKTVYIAGDAQSTIKEALLQSGFKAPCIQNTVLKDLPTQITQTTNKHFLIANYTALYEFYDLLH